MHVQFFSSRHPSIHIDFQENTTPDLIYTCIYKKRMNEVEIHYEHKIFWPKEKQCTIHLAAEKMTTGYFYKVLAYCYDGNSLKKIGEFDGCFSSKTIGLSISN